MDRTAASNPNHGRAAIVAVLWLAMLPSVMGNPAATDLALREQARRGVNVEEAQFLLEKGDEAYQAARYAEAVEAYAGARELLPIAPVTAELRAAATERFAQASVEHARVLSLQGDVPAAKTVVDKVLDPGMAPNHPGARDFRARLDDPIRTNPALTAEHTQNVDQVRRALYTAEGAYNLGKFDEAKRHYESVLRIDPTNSAARRGMERLAAARSGYQKSAYDHARAELLAQVDAGWETAVPPTDEELDLADSFTGVTRLGDIRIETKLTRIIIPRIALDQATLDEAIDFLRVRSAELDTLEPDPARRGVNITTNLGPPDSETSLSIRGQRFDLQLANVPLALALKYITEITRTSYSVDEFSVVIRPAGFTSDELISRSYRVPPDFLTSLSAGAGNEGGADDPFGDPFGERPAGGLLTTRLSAQEALTRQGVSFPDGAFANYNAATNTLRVNNTAVNQDYIAQIVEAMSQSEPVQVVVRVTMIRTEQTDLEELGFDWLVNPLALNSQDTLFGSGGTIGSASGRTAGDFSDIIPGLPTDTTAPVSQGVVTNGLRSGDQAISGNTVDNLLNDPNRDAQRTSVAPGIMSITGLFTDGQAQMVMRGLNQKKGVDLMANPSTVTRSGQASSIHIVREFIYPTEYEPPEIPTSTGIGGGVSPVTPATPTAFEMREVGMILEVLPVADPDKRYIDVTINPSFVDFEGFVNYGSPIRSAVNDSLGLGSNAIELSSNQILMPVFSTQRASTQVTVADGATIAIGGLMRQGVELVEDKVPLLGDLPWAGRLFRSTSRRPVTTALVFLVQVELQDPTGRPYRDR